MFPDLLFLAFLENSKENRQKGKDFFCLPNKILGREGKKAQNRKEFLEKEKARKTKEERKRI